jgi:hypothetical protein
LLKYILLKVSVLNFQRCKKKINIKPRVDPEFKVLWGIDSEQLLQNDITSAIISCVIKDKHKDWKNSLNDVKNFMDKNTKKPAKSSKILEEKSLGIWIDHQLVNYREKTQIMENDYIRKLWESTVDFILTKI